MNLVGKIFTVLLLVMSLVFMSFAVAVYATHKNWRKVVDNPKELATREHPLGLKQQLADEEVRNEELKELRDELKTELKTQEAAKREALTKLENEKALLHAANLLLREKDAKLVIERRKSVALTEAAESRLLAYTGQLDTLRVDIRKVETDRDSHFKEVVRLTDLLHQTINERERVKERNRQVAADLAKAMLVLRKFGYKAEPTLYDGPPQVDGVVTGISSAGQVQISIGADDGLLKGHKLYVYRIAGGPANYVARIEIIKTTPDKSACKVDPKTQRSHIQVGDRVTTRLREPPRIPPK